MATQLPIRAGGPEDFPLYLRPMAEGDLTRVMEIERQVYSAPWSRGIFLQDLTSNNLSRYVIAEQGPFFMGYAGIWIFEQIGHITTVAVNPQHQRRGIGSHLLEAIMVIGRTEGVVRFTLEVRVSNIAAQKLYQKHGYYAVGIRPRYYQDDKEDALIMWTDPDDDTWDKGFTG